MLTFEEAQARVLSGVEAKGSERVGVLEALGRVLAERLEANRPMPAFDYSAMDGYAVASESFSGSGPWSLQVVGESRTGASAPRLERGTACRIFTGAVLPEGADAVVMQEDVERSGDQARFKERPQRFDHVRRRGEDLDSGATALEVGTRIGPDQIGLIAALDRPSVAVARRPRVSILCTGDELRAPGEPPRPSSIPESNGVALAARVRQVGGEPVLLPFARDDSESTLRSVRDALSDADVLLTVGGVSVGDHDVVRPALEAAGAKLDFWKVRIKPGKPLVYGHVGRTRILGLPGNPVSAQVTFALFGVPLLRRLQGDAKPVAPLRRARLAEAVRQKPGRRAYLRGVLDGDRVSVWGNQASGAPTSLAWANCLVIIPEDSEGFEAGSDVSVLALGDL